MSEATARRTPANVVENAAWHAFDAGTLANRATAALRAYDPGHDLPALRARFGREIAELGSNENPLGPSPRAIDAMRDALGETFRYPDPRGLALKAALAAHHGVDVDRIALGNGSHELLILLAQCFADPEHSIVFSQYGFAVFPIATAVTGAIALRVPALSRTHATAPFGHDLDAMAAAIRGDTRIVYRRQSEQSHRDMVRRCRARPVCRARAARRAARRRRGL